MNVQRTLFPRLACTLAAFLALPLAAQTILPAPEAGKLVPNTVFFAGRSATTQLRNSAGVRFADGSLTLAVLVDTSGYSTSVQQKYQGYLLTEAPLVIGGHSIVPGAYAIGFPGNRFVLMDIGNHQLLEAAATRDATMVHPRPLQIFTGASTGTERLCFGRSCVEFRSAK